MLILLMHMLVHFGNGRNTSKEHGTSILNSGGLCRQPTLVLKTVLMKCMMRR